MNDRYKKYFDSISPEKKLTEDTLAKMYEELNCVSEPKKFDIKLWAALAVCTAAAVSAVLFSPDIKNIGNSNSDNLPAAENPSVTLNTTVCTSECTGSHTHSIVLTELSQGISCEYTDSLVSSSVQDPAAVPESKPSSGTAVTDKTSSEPVLTAGGKVTTPEKVDVTEKNTETEKVTEVTTKAETRVTADATLPSFNEPELTHACTTAKNPEGGLPPQATTKVTSLDTPVSTMVSSESASIPDVEDPAVQPTAEPTSKPPGAENWYTEYIDGYEIKINYAEYCYDNSVGNEEPVELSKAEEVLGKGIIPESALSMSSEHYSYAGAGDSSFDYGFCMSIGTTGIPVADQDDYILFSVSPSDYSTSGYTPVYYNPSYTYINGRSLCFGVADELPGVYFCTFNKNNLRYRIMVRGYSLYDLVYIITNM